MSKQDIEVIYANLAKGHIRPFELWLCIEEVVRKATARIDEEIKHARTELENTPAFSAGTDSVFYFIARTTQEAEISRKLNKGDCLAAQRKAIINGLQLDDGYLLDCYEAALSLEQNEEERKLLERWVSSFGYIKHARQTCEMAEGMTKLTVE